MRKGLRNKPKLFLATIIGLIAFFSVFSQASVAAVARGYASSDTGLQTGMVVSLSLNGPDNSSVERATQESSNRVLGIVTTENGSLVTVSSGTAKVLVESEGQVDAYVSDINGEIQRGDLLIVSPLKGILMKADKTAAPVIGIAADAPTEKSTYSYNDNGQTKETQIAKVGVNLNLKGSNNASAVQSDSSLAKLGRTIAGKEVSEIRVLIALILFVIVLIAEGAIIYGAISSALTALGRNPLGKKVINGELAKVIIVALLVLLVGLGAVFAVLRA